MYDALAIYTYTLASSDDFVRGAGGRGHRLPGRGGAGGQRLLPPLPQEEEVRVPQVRVGRRLDRTLNEHDQKVGETLIMGI